VEHSASAKASGRPPITICGHLLFRFLFAYNSLGTNGGFGHGLITRAGEKLAIHEVCQMLVQNELGTRIRELRTQKGWSQESFADRCGINRSHMGDIERGETNVTLATLRTVAQALGTTAAALLQGIA